MGGFGGGWVGVHWVCLFCVLILVEVGWVLGFAGLGLVCFVWVGDLVGLDLGWVWVFGLFCLGLGGCLGVL